MAATEPESPADEWLAMAEESARAATLLLDDGLYRSAASRCYYSAYASATALLHQAGEVPPVINTVPRDAWTHAHTRRLMQQKLRPLIRSDGFRNRLVSSLSRLYKLRLVADYDGRQSVAHAAVEAALRESTLFLKIATDRIRGGDI